ncbi:MAG: indolepyruvate oxidoreductase subunit beta [Deltaproteobacteria bacterium]|nr:indolepyruvate oxidoreductase subunit beta [Deltaproteobacteria bacterium]
MRDAITNVLIVGVGGQGVILASNALSEVAVRSGFDVKKNESHGQSQRGGTVPSHVRFGRRVYSPLIPRGEADVLLAFEELEGLRFAHFLKPGGTFLLNRQRIYPPSVTSGLHRYPENVPEILEREGIRPIGIDALAIAAGLGNPVVASAVLLGVLSAHLSLEQADWEAVLGELVGERHRAINLAAFAAGRDEARRRQG